MADGKVKMTATRIFTRNFGAGMMHGNPDHPRPEGREFEVDEGIAAAMEAAGVAERQGSASKAAPVQNPDGSIVQDPLIVTGGNDRFAGQSLDKRPLSDEVRESTTSGARATKTRRGKAAKGAAKDLPVGGTDTTATTNHPKNSAPDTATADPDAAPAS